MSKVNMQVVKEGAAKAAFTFTALVSILAVALICVFLLSQGVPTIGEIGLSNFFGIKWNPSKGLYGIGAFIVGSLYVTAGAIVVGVPIGLLCAIFLAYFCNDKLYKILHPAVQLLFQALIS